MSCLQTLKTPWQKEDGVEENGEKTTEGEKEAAGFAFRPCSN